MDDIYTIPVRHTEDLYATVDSLQARRAEGHTAPVPCVKAEEKANLLKILVLFCVLLVATLIVFSVYHVMKLKGKEQDLEDLKHAYDNLTSSYNLLLEDHTTLQSQYTRNYSALMESRMALESQYTRNYSAVMESRAALESQYTRNFSDLMESRAALVSECTRNYSILLESFAALEIQYIRNYSTVMEGRAALEAQCARNYSTLLESRAALESWYTRKYSALLKSLSALKIQCIRNYSAQKESHAAFQAQCARNYSTLLESCAALECQYTRNYSVLLEKHATLQSQFSTLKEKHNELSKELSKVKEYYSYVINTSHEETCTVCKVGWVPFNSKCYFFSTSKLTWTLSHNQCTRMGGHLVIVGSLKEQEFLENKINTIGDEDKAYWIGLHDRVKEDEFVWVDGTPLHPYNSFWDVREPNGGHKENCVQIRIKLQWRSWHEFSCGTLTKWICETTAFLLHN